MSTKSFFNVTKWEKLKDFCQDKSTPFLVVDLEEIESCYKDFETHFHYAKVYYAIKANPDARVLDLLNRLGSNFDIASRYELDKALAVGVDPLRISYGNTIKKAEDIRYFYEKGVRLFVSDSEEDIRKIAEHAPGVKIFLRILTDGSQTADWPLSRKFGCHQDMAYDLLVLAQSVGLDPYGISFHVGSQQRDIGTWDEALAKVKFLFRSLSEEKGIHLRMINLGGGFPARYQSKLQGLDVYAEEILRYLEDDFGDDLPEILIEPGRALVGNAGVLVTEVVLCSRKSRSASERWVYIDCGKFGGLIETLDESIKYPVRLGRDTIADNEEVILAGPTCDSMDVLYEKTKYELPLDLREGDRLYWFGTGAYTTSYSAVEFNGFPPLKLYVME
jgi:ornithine decarboxylase